MVQPLVSVVIPTIERPAYLKRAIESVLKQTYPYLEIIVVIDGKSAHSKEMMSQYKAAHSMNIKCIETGEKVGGSEARNIGARIARGKFVALLDDDDEWLPEKITAQMDHIQQANLTNHEDFICFSSVFVYDIIDQPQYNQLPLVPYKSAPSKRLSDYLFETKGLTRIGWIQTSSILVPTHLLLTVPFTKGLPKHQDWDWLLHLDRAVPLTVIQVEKAMTIYHSDVPKTKRVGVSNQWAFSEKWLWNHRADFSQKGYDSFVLDLLLPSIASDETLTKKERAAEMKRLLKGLSFNSYFMLFTWKMLLFFVVRNNDFLFKSIQKSLFLTTVRKKLF